MKKKVLVASLLVLILAFSAAAGGYAATKLTLIVNGQKAAVDPILIDGTTYVPLRAAAEMLDANVGWDSATQTVTVTSKAPAAAGGGEATKPTSGVGLSRSNAAPVGATVTLAVDGLLDKYTAEFTLEETIRGDRAWELVKAANMFNDAAPEGQEYLLAKIKVKVVKNEKADAAVSISGASFTAVSSAGKDYTNPFAVSPDPGLNASLYEGASDSGWITLLVNTDDEAPLITFGRKFDGTGGVWLKP